MRAPVGRGKDVPIVRLVARHPVASFLVLLYAITWTVFLPVVLQARGLLALPIELSEGLAFNAVLAIASILGIALPAFLVRGATGGKAGVRDLLGRCLRWRVGVRWYLLALLGFLAATLLVASPFLGLAPLEALVQKWPLFFILYLPEVLFPFVFIQLFEEAGWTGFMQHTLQERRGPLVASILVAPAFVVQHLPIVLMDASVGLGSVIVVGALMVVAVFFRVVIIWLYNGSGRSVLVVALFHSAYNAAWGTGDHKFANEVLSGSALPYAVLAVAVIALVLAITTRGRLAREPERAGARPAETADVPSGT